jgi:ribosomal protein S18
MPHGSDAAEYADYKNVAFLEQFLSPAGKLLPRWAAVHMGRRCEGTWYPVVVSSG